jgi:hypothetical protein
METWGTPWATVVADGCRKTVPVRIHGPVFQVNGALQGK